MMQSKMKTVNLKPEHIKAAEAVLSKGDRVELIPVKDGVKVMRVRREDVQKEYKESGEIYAQGFTDGFAGGIKATKNLKEHIKEINTDSRK